MSMPIADSRIQAVLMLLLSIAINLAFFYGLITRPVILYHLTTPLEYNKTVDFDVEKLRVDLRVMNRGGSPARVWLVARIYNMSLIGAEALSVAEFDGVSVLRIPRDVPARRSGYETLELKFDAAANSTYLALIFSVEADWEANPAVRFHNGFAVYKPERPTALLLKHVGGRIFVRVRRK